MAPFQCRWSRSALRRVPLSGSSAAFLLLLGGGALTEPCPVHAQVATATTRENFRTEPNGALVAELLPGTMLDVRQRQDRWVQAELEGWVWARSLQVVDREGYDLIVSEEEGENLRAEPRGTILAHLERGALLHEVERRPGWILVRREGWVWAPSMRLTEGAPPGAEVPPGGTVAPSGGSASQADPGGRSAGPASIPTPAAASASSAGPVRVPGRGLSILSAPDGDTLARAVPGTDVEVTGREGNWARVRVEGWAWIPDSPDPPGDSPGLPDAVDATPEAVASAPERFRGRMVSWRLQFISLERAEKVRTEFFEGEPFLLMRPTGGGGSFVYVAVPPDRMGAVEGLIPLERIVVTGRVRVGASALTGSPILDLVELRREGGRK